MSEAAAAESSRWSSILRLFRRTVWKLLLWFIIASAVLVSLGRLLAPYADHARPLLEQILSHALNQPVQISRVEAQWPRLSPQIHLSNLTVGTPENAMLQVDRARLELKLYNLLRPAYNSFELIGLGLNLGLLEDEQGRWSWQIEGGGTVRDGWQRGLSAGDLKLRSSSVRIVPFNQRALSWDVPEADLNRLGNRLRIRFSALESVSQHRRVDDDGVPLGIDDRDVSSPWLVKAELKLDDDGLSSLRSYLTIEDSSVLMRLQAMLGEELQARLNLDVLDQARSSSQVWLDWTVSEPLRFHAQLSLQGLADQAGVTLQLDGRSDKEDLTIEVNSKDAPELEPWIDQLVFSRQDGLTGVSLQRADLARLNALLSAFVKAEPLWPQRLEGVLEQFAVAWWPDGTPFLFRGQLDGFGVTAGSIPFNLGPLDLGLALHGDRYGVSVSGQPELQWAFLYDRPIAFESLDAELVLSTDSLEVRTLQVVNEAFDFKAQGQLLRPDPIAGFAGPFMDLTIDLGRISSPRLNRWLPQRGLPSKTRNWLDQALLSIESGKALTTLHGWPQGWKQYTPPGAVHSLIDVQGLDLQYGQNWPRGEKLSGRVEFLSEQMLAEMESGTISGTTITAPSIEIPQLRRAQVELNLASDGATAEQLLGLVQSLPLEQARTALDLMHWQGAAEATARVMLPVKQIQDWQMNGQVRLDGVDFHIDEPGFAIEQLQAQVPFSRERIGPATLQGQALQQSVELQLDAQIWPELDLSIQGEVPTAALLPLNWQAAAPEALAAITERIDGQSLWQFNIQRAATRHSQPPATDAMADTSERSPLMLSLQSKMTGTALSLPLPLSKPAEQEWPLHIELELQPALRAIRFGVMDVIDGQLQVEPDYWQLGLGFGGLPAKRPMAENFHIAGQIDALALGDWLELIADMTQSTDRLMLRSQGIDDDLTGWLDLDIGSWSLGQAELGAIEVALAREQNVWRLNFDGQSMRGSIQTPATPSALPAAVARFDYLHWPLGEPEQLLEEPRMVDPRSLPELQIAIEDLRWGNLPLGQLRVVSHARQEGLEIEQFSLGRAGLQLAGSGRWVASADELAYPFNTQARLRLTDDNFGRSLQQAGYQLALERGRALIELDGSWPGSPLDFSLTRLNGELDLLIDDGVIAEAQPGAGRLLGLVSLGSIPRRLRLDFSDVFGSGFGFDRVAGHFDLEAGLARTDDLSISAPAADIDIRGQTNLAERVYNQTMRVRPGLGSTLPIIGALTGGPIGAAAGVALEQLLNEPISGLSEIEYRVTGSWEDPLVETIGARGAPLVEADAAAGGEPERNLPESG